MCIYYYFSSKASFLHSLFCNTWETMDKMGIQVVQLVSFTRYDRLKDRKLHPGDWTIMPVVELRSSRKSEYILKKIIASFTSTSFLIHCDWSIELISFNIVWRNSLDSIFNAVLFGESEVGTIACSCNWTWWSKGIRNPVSI